MGGKASIRGNVATAVAVSLALVSLVAVRSGPAAAAIADGVIEGRVTLASGQVTFSGTPPAGQTLDMSADPYCRDQHDGAVVDRPVRVDANGGVAEVLVHVRNAPDGGEPPEPTVLDQIGCLYTPAVVAVRAGQELTIRNSDETLHNVRVTPEINRGFNLGQPLEGIESKRSFPLAELGIPVRCDIHGWMHATVHVLDHGFFAVTEGDGSFALPALPPGSYEVEAWHPTLGTTGQTITVTAGATATVSFEFSG